MPSFAWNQATATFRPRALSDGPFTGTRGRPSPRRRWPWARSTDPFQPRYDDVAHFGGRSIADRDRPSDAIATAVGQHSQTRRSSAASGACVQLRSKLVNRSDMSPDAWSPAGRARVTALHLAAVEPDEPESQSRASGRVTRSRARSWCRHVRAGMTAPRSFRHLSNRRAARRRRRCRARSSAASARRAYRPRDASTEGTSAQFTNQSVPDATVAGVDQPRRCALKTPASPDRRSSRPN